MEAPPEGVWGIGPDRLADVPGFGGDVQKNREAARQIMKEAGYGPDKPLKILVGFPAGGGTDVMARFMAAALKQRTGRHVIIDNKAGASGTIAVADLKNAESAEDIVDALIDLCVVAIGTLDCFNVDADEAWCRVLDANMKKVPGVKESRPNPLGLPDLIKPEGWVAPNHGGNHGRLTEIF